MATSHDQPTTTDGIIEGEELLLEPTATMVRPSLGEDRPAPRPSARVEVVEGSVASLSAETAALRRRRVASAALFLMAAYGVLVVWSLVAQDDATRGLVLLMMGARLVIATGVAVVLLRPISLSSGQVRWAEYVLFGGFTLVLMVSQFTVNRALMQQGDVPGVITYVKNGVFQMFALMVLYGTFIPNNTRGTARVVLSMALAHILSLTLMAEYSGAAGVLEHLRTTHQAGSNVLSLLIGAAFAIYSAYVLNNLRTQLHEARQFGQYRLREKVGAGGMGEVYLAEHQLLKRPCAVKLIKPEACDDPIALARFEREVQSAARLSHPNTIAIFDYGHTNDGTFYYVMEYLRGMSLAELVRHAGPLPPGRVVYLMRQACAGLAEAHALGLVHRDLKPGNIFVALRGGESDVAKVLDFGLVKLTRDPDAADLTSDQMISGTPLYMAPEQATGERDLDARADIYALGGIAYYALTGRPPFVGGNAFAVMMAHARDPLVPPSKVRPGLPDDLAEVVLRCLAKSPDDRFPDIKALGKALAACACAADWDAEKADQWWAADIRPVGASSVF